MEYCICGHGEISHNMRILDPSGYPKKTGCHACEKIWFDNGGKTVKQVLHPFKLDNLKFIEDLAKEKGFV